MRVPVVGHATIAMDRDSFLRKNVNTGKNAHTVTAMEGYGRSVAIRRVSCAWHLDGITMSGEIAQLVSFAKGVVGLLYIILALAMYVAKQG